MIFPSVALGKSQAKRKHTLDQSHEIIWIDDVAALLYITGSFTSLLISSLSITAMNTSCLSLPYLLTPCTSRCPPPAAGEERKTGDLGGALCRHAVHQPLATLAKFNLEHGSGPDIYGILEIDGFNLLCGSPA